MFSGLPQLADKAFVVGFLVPVLFGVLAMLTGFREFPWVVATLHSLGAADDAGKLTVFAACVILAALGLLMLNRPIYRALEGYIGPLSARALRDRAFAEWHRRDRERQALRDRAEAYPEGSPERDAAAIAYRRALRAFRRAWPRSIATVLPTRFGNVNRAFEGYAASVHDVEAILVWPRLSAIIPKDFQDVLTDARAQVNCFVNLAFIAALVIAARLGLWAAEAAWWLFAAPPAARAATHPIALMDYATAVAGLLATAAIARAAYEMAVERAMALGDQVKVAFDLYLPTLPAKLGYAWPADPAARKAFWAALEDAWDFQNPPDGLIPAPPPAAPQAAAPAVQE